VFLNFKKIFVVEKISWQTIWLKLAQVGIWGWDEGMRNACVCLSDGLPSWVYSPLLVTPTIILRLIYGVVTVLTQQHFMKNLMPIILVHLAFS